MSNIEEDAQELKNLMGADGANTDKIIKFICQKTKEERVSIKNKYNEIYGVQLLTDLLSEFKEEQNETLEALLDDPIEYDAKELKNTMKGLGTNEENLIEILCSRKSDQIKQIKEKYQNLFSIELHTDIMNETSSDFQTYLISLLQEERSSNKNPDLTLCEEMAKSLYENGEGKIGTNEKVFIDFLSKSSAREIIVTCRLYHKKYEKTIFEVLESEFSSDILTALKTTLSTVINPGEYFAEKVHKFLKEERNLVRVLLTREEIDMPIIREYYKFLFNADMVEDIKSNTTGILQKILEVIAQKDFPAKK